MKKKVSFAQENALILSVYEIIKRKTEILCTKCNARMYITFKVGNHATSLLLTERKKTQSSRREITEKGTYFHIHKKSYKILI